MAFKTLKAAVASLLLVSSFANAGIIWDNGASDPANFGANFSEGVNQLADNFTLNSNETLRSVQFWGGHWNTGQEPAIEGFTANVYFNNGGSVGALAGTSLLNLFSKIDTGFDHNNFAGANILEFTMNLVNPLALAAGDYWFSVVSQDNPNTNFYWQQNIVGSSRLSSNGGSSWVNNGSELAFNLSNNFVAAQPTQQVPEPSTIALLALSILGVASRKMKK